MATPKVPSNAARKKFIEKLNQFRGTLDADEQQMLDALVQAARQAHEQHEVSVYWLTSSTGPRTDVWNPYAGTATYSGQRAGGY
jgi:hypothetical protein